jgi:hypothetical protein
MVHTLGGTRKVIARIPESNGLYNLTNGWNRGETANSAKTILTIDEFHRRMGHISPKVAEHMVKAKLIEGIELDPDSTPTFCTACTQAKLARTAVPKTRSEGHTAQDLGDRIHSDLWGPAQTTALTGESYFVSFTKAWTEIDGMRVKDQTFTKYKEYEAWLHTQFKVVVKELHCDGGGEYINDVFDAHLKAKGTVRTVTVHDTPEQNGIAERLNRTLLERARAMMIATGLPRFLWLEAVRHGVWLKNRTPTKALNGKTPHKAVGFGNQI